MNYEQFISEVQTYWDMRSKGLKKQANGFLSEFIKRFRENVSKGDADDILFQFCKEYFDEMKFPGTNLPRRHLPFQITELLDSYLSQECKKNRMPQMRWAFQIFGRYYNPHDPKGEHNPYDILKQAYEHEQCDEQTVKLYFGVLLEDLWLGQPHFPEHCCLAKGYFEQIVGIANRIIEEKTVDLPLVEDYKYYVKLYHIYFRWDENGRTEDFCELCHKNGVEFREVAAYYFRGQ